MNDLADDTSLSTVVNNQIMVADQRNRNLKVIID